MPAHVALEQQCETGEGGELTAIRCPRPCYPCCPGQRCSCHGQVWGPWSSPHSDFYCTAFASPRQCSECHFESFQGLNAHDERLVCAPSWSLWKVPQLAPRFSSCCSHQQLQVDWWPEASPPPCACIACACAEASWETGSLWRSPIRQVALALTRAPPASAWSRLRKGHQSRCASPRYCQCSLWWPRQCCSQMPHWWCSVSTRTAGCQLPCVLLAVACGIAWPQLLKRANFPDSHCFGCCLWNSLPKHCWDLAPAHPSCWCCGWKTRADFGNPELCYSPSGSRKNWNTKEICSLQIQHANK